MYNKPHLSSILNYLGVGLIRVAIGQLYTDKTDSILLALLGIVLFLIGDYLRPGEKRHLTLLLSGIIYAVSIAMLIAGISNFFVSPEASLRFAPLGFLLSLAVYPRKELHITIIWRKYALSLVIGLLISGLLYAIMYTSYHRLPQLFDASNQPTTNPFPAWMQGLDESEIQEHCAQMPDMEGCNTSRGYQSGDIVTGSVNTGSGQPVADSHTMNHADMVNNEFEFIALMIPHHQEAVDTSTRLSQITRNPFYTYLTNNIVNGQTKEIKMMKEWLDQWYSGKQYTGMAYMPMMRDTSAISAITTIEKMRTEDMITHHQGAVDMANKVLTLNPRQEVREFALAIINTQSQEIDLMKQQLGTMTTDNSLESMQKDLDGMSEPAIMDHTGH